MAIWLGVVGVGKIARDQHLPVIAADKRFELVAAASRNATVEGVKNYKSLAQMLAGEPRIEAVALCAPPLARTADARLALKAGKHVFLEKPPAATLTDAEHLLALAQMEKVALLASWHSRHAPAVAQAAAWLQGKTIRAVEIAWKEDVRHWHPGQDWIFAAGGFGVFDPAINAFSIATHILPPFALRSARLAFPENRQAPIAGELAFELEGGAPLRVSLDFLQTGPQTWDIRVETDAGELILSKGGSELAIDAAPVTLAAGADLLHGEYRELYAHFAALVAKRQIDCDLAPLRHVADAFLLGERVLAPPFHF
jgi:D-galactose 1-dehydrogenase